MTRSPYHPHVRTRLTKAQVEDLFAAMDGDFDDVKAALETAIAHLHGSADLDAVLRRHGREGTADRLARRDEDAAWALAAELNERRHL